MAILKIARLGHPVLRSAAEPLEPKSITSADVQSFLDDLIDTMREYDGVGLAAPQVHEPVRVVVYEVPEGRRSGRSGPTVPLTVLVNPIVTPLTARTKEDWEGCLSLPDLRGKVPRYTKVRVEALDRNGESVEFVAKDFHARVIQHECDHLDGRLFIDRMKDLSTLAFLPEFLRYAGVDGDVED